MPTHLLLEGEDIESVLARLRDDHGPEAKIVQAELVRSGGFAGFFAKRRYEVTVEVADEPLLGSAELLPGSAELREVREGFEVRFESSPEAAPKTARMSSPETSTATAPETSTATAPETSPATAPQPTAIDVLLRAAEGADQAEIGGHVMAENDRPAPPFVPTGPGWHRPVSTEGTAFSDVLSSLTQNLAEQRSVRPMVDALVPEPRKALDPPQSVQPQPAVEVRQGPVLPAEPPAEPVFERMVKDLSRCREQLAAIGVPEPLLAKIASSEPLLALRDLVEAADEPQRPAWTRSATRGGALVVVVGSWAIAESTVHGLVQELEVDAAAVLAVATAVGAALPAGQSVRSHAAAVQLVRRSRQAHDVSVLVVDPGTGRHAADRVAELVAVLEPQHVLVAATVGEDLPDSLAAVDALAAAQVAVDGLALDGVAGSSSPAAAFEIPLPVSWIDGRFATSGRWIGLLVDAMSRAGADRC